MFLPGCDIPAAFHILRNIRNKLKFIFNKVCDHFSLILTVWAAHLITDCFVILSKCNCWTTGWSKMILHNSKLAAKKFLISYVLGWPLFLMRTQNSVVSLKMLNYTGADNFVVSTLTCSAAALLVFRVRVPVYNEELLWHVAKCGSS